MEVSTKNRITKVVLKNGVTFLLKEDIEGNLEVTKEVNFTDKDSICINPSYGNKIILS